jgi:hypothetical protein
MGQLIGPIPRNWWKTLKDIRESMISEKANGNVETARMEARMFKTNLGRFIKAEDLSVAPKAA